MKKIIPLILTLAMVFSFVGCSQKPSYVPENAKTYGYFYFPNTNWGMTQEELYSALNKKASDFDITTDSSSEGGLYTINYLATNMKFLNTLCNVVFTFQSIPGTEKIALNDVKLVYPIKNETYVDMTKKLESLLSEEGISYTSKDSSTSDLSTITYTSKNTTLNLPDDIQKGYLSYIKKLNDKKTLITPDVDKLTIASLAENLSTLSLRYAKDTDGNAACVIEFKGSAVATPVCFAEADKK